MEKFFLGMDIGTNSVGMACTDEKYKLLRAAGRDCWAVRLFDESHTAAERRVARTARRRLERRKQRIGFLQSLFALLIEDKTFFIRLNNSQYSAEDKSAALNGDVNNLFSDDGFKDKDYHKKYPTIFHLRKALMSEPVTDLRLYYLALHHIVKYRGHFLFEGSMAEFHDASKLFEKLNAVCVDLYEERAPLFDTSKVSSAKEILLQRGKDREKRLIEFFAANDGVSKEIIKGICGYKISPQKLFVGRYKEEKSFSAEELSDEAFDALQATFGDDFALLESIRSVCNYITFERLLSGNSDISSAMIALYNKHAADLALLKKYIREHGTQEEYNRFFKFTGENSNYVNYIGYTKKGGDKKKVKICGREEFYRYTKDFLKKLSDDVNEDLERINNEIENKIFLPKILHADNGLFPYQVNEDELKKIIDNMVKNCPQTAGMAKAILPVFLYRIPYYVGPLTGKNSWAVRKEGKENEKVTPWNFKDVIDEAKSNEGFMRKMTGKCSYLYAEDVLPKFSVYYQSYNVLNQLNKLKINDCPISVELKQKIFKELFLTKKKVTDNAIKDLLVRCGKISESEKKSVTISGKDGELSVTMSSYIQLKTILGEFADEDLKNGGGVCENIILWHTLNTEKRIVEYLIMKNYGDTPVIAHNIKALKGLVFKDFGRLSKKFLCDIRAVDKETGELLTVTDILYRTNNNLNELLFSEQYNWQEVIRKENGEITDEITYEDIEKLYVSPAVRRGIWQSLKMADEYVRKIGKTPDKIFVEVTREDGVKGEAGRTISRKKQLQEKYKGIEGIADLTAELNEKTDLDLRSERLYLYFRQLGKCMYSGERIDLSTLSTDRYDVDHILPRTYIKDDGLDNKVLVLRSKNAEKTDVYPIPYGLVTAEARKHWQILLKKGLISDTNYKRLTRTEPLNDDDYGDFISRQKTITDQTAKAVIGLMAKKYPSTKMVYSKAKNVSDFKQKFNLHKCRETNDLHHARDAYLNIVVGNVYDTCFATPMAMFNKDGDKWRTYNLKTMFTRTVKGAWEQENNQSLLTVKKTYAKTSMSVTQYAYCFNGEFYDQTIYGKEDTGITAPRKLNGPLSDTSRYGGYKSQNTAYFAVVSSKGKKEKTIKTIEAVPVMVSYKAKNDPNFLQRYFESYLHQPVVLIEKLKKKQLVSYNGTLCYLAGVTGERIIVHNAVELFTDNKTDEYVNALGKLSDMEKNGRIDTQQEEYVIKTNRLKEVKLTVNRKDNIALYDYLLEKLNDKRYFGVGSFLSYYRTLLKAKEIFDTLSVLKQAATLLQILRFFKCNAETSDLSTIGGSNRSGTIRINKDITETEFSIIHRSACGLTERRQKV